jgi:hypothetical protein
VAFSACWREMFLINCGSNARAAAKQGCHGRTKNGNDVTRIEWFPRRARWNQVQNLRRARRQGGRISPRVSASGGKVSASDPRVVGAAEGAVWASGSAAVPG